VGIASALPSILHRATRALYSLRSMI
jgi:hypothetical protein